MVIPAFGGADRAWQAAGITDDRGLVPVDAQYRSRTYPTIFAAGGAARLDLPSPRAGIPKTGYLASAMAKRAARNLAATLQGTAPAARPLPRLLDARLLDGGGAGMVLICLDLWRPLRIAIQLPGRGAHLAKLLLLRYLLWKLRTGRTALP